MTPEKEKVFQKIYEENDKRLYQYIYRQTGHHADAEDLLHETFIVLLFHLDEFLPNYSNNPKRVRAFLFGVAHQNLLHYWRKHKKILDMEISVELLPDLPDPKNLLDSGPLLPDWLTAQDRKLLFLRASGYSLKEIGAQLGISYGACRMRSVRLLAELKIFEKNEK